MNTNNTQYPMSSRFVVGSVVFAPGEKSESGAPTHLTSAYPEASLSKAKDTSPGGIEQSLMLSDPSIPKSTYVSSSPWTTGQQKPTSSGIASGPENKDFVGRSEQQSHVNGSVTARNLLPLDPPALIVGTSKTFNAIEKAMDDVMTFGAGTFKIEHVHPESFADAEANARAGVGLGGQVAGVHYKKMKIQPIEFVHANNIGYCEGSVIKYVSRWRDKGGIEDLRKAKHFIDILIELETKANGTK